MIQAAESAMDTQDAPKEASSQTAASTSNLPEAEAYATLLVTQYLVDNKLCSEVCTSNTLLSCTLQLLTTRLTAVAAYITGKGSDYSCSAKVV